MNGFYLAQYPLYKIYEHLITPILHRIGESWKQGKISVSEEHLASQMIRDAITRLQGIISLPKEKISNVLCLNFSDELHDIALKMVAHILEIHGFRVIFTGQITPIVDIEQLFDKFHPKRVYISSTFISNTAVTQSEFDRICHISSNYKSAVYVGGRGFNSLKINHPSVKGFLKDFKDVDNL